MGLKSCNTKSSDLWENLREGVPAKYEKKAIFVKGMNAMFRFVIVIYILLILLTVNQSLEKYDKVVIMFVVLHTADCRCSS